MLPRALFAILTLAAPLAASVTPGDIEVRVNPGQVYLRASGAPLSAVLERLAALTGMKLQFEGTPPAQRMITEFTRSTPIEAVLTLLDGLDVAYAAQVDSTGTRIQTLLIASRSAVATSARPTGPGRPGGPPPRTFRGMPAEPLPEPETPEPEDDEVAPPPEPEAPPAPAPTGSPAPSPTPPAPDVKGPFVYAPFPNAQPAATPQAQPSPATP
jgi:hypothetical protein